MKDDARAELTELVAQVTEHLRYRHELGIELAGESVVAMVATAGEQACETLEEIRRVVTVFRELRSGVTLDGKTKLKSPTGTLSTAEAISVINNGLSLAAHFGDGRLRAPDLASSVIGAIVKDPVQDRVVWQEYLETVVKERDGWKDLYRACRES